MKRSILILAAAVLSLVCYGSDSLKVFYRIRLDQDIDKAAQRLVVLGLEKADEAEADYVLTLTEVPLMLPTASGLRC